MSNMATVSTCSKCGLSYRDSLIPHECAEWTKGRKEAKETQPVSDTLQEQEDAILTTIRNSDDAQREQVQESDWCDDCHGYVHAPWCPHYSETAKEVVTDQTATATQQPSAQGGGDDGELRPGMNPTCLRCFNDGWDAHRRGLHPANFHAGFATQDAPHTCNQHQALVAEREQMLDALKGVAVMLNTALAKYDEEPWAQRVRAAIVNYEQRSTSE